MNFTLNKTTFYGRNMHTHTKESSDILPKKKITIHYIYYTLFMNKSRTYNVGVRVLVSNNAKTKKITFIPVYLH